MVYGQGSIVLEKAGAEALAAFTGQQDARRRTAEFFTAELRSDNTRRAYLNAKASSEHSAWPVFR